MRDFKLDALVIPPRDIQERAKQIGVQLNYRLAGENPIFIGILNAAFMFTADVVRWFMAPCEVAFIQASSYTGQKQSRKVKVQLPRGLKIEGRVVVLLDTIFDSGATFRACIDSVGRLKPRIIHTASMFSKIKERKSRWKPDVVGFEIKDQFVVGYGLDLNGEYRNLYNLATVRK